MAAGTMVALGEGKDIGKTILAVKASNKAWQRQKTLAQKMIQWRVRDLRAAGLNPVLAAQGALGSAGAPATPGTSFPNTGDASDRFGKTMAGEQSNLMKDQIRSQIAANNAAAARQTAAVDTELENQNQMRATAELYGANARQVEAQTDLVRTRIDQAQANQELWQFTPTRRILQLQELIKNMILPLMNPPSQGVPRDRFPEPFHDAPPIGQENWRDGKRGRRRPRR